MSAAIHVLSVSDWLKLPEVAAPTLRDESETGTMVIVAKVGFLLATDADCKKANITADHGLNGKRVLPTAMVQDGDHASLHRLPTDLAPWVMDAVALAHAGRNQFPSRVEFGRLNGRIYAQFGLTNERSH
jgi:hypothetical protein